MSPQEFWLLADDLIKTSAPRRDGPERVGTMPRAVFDDLVGVLRDA